MVYQDDNTGATSDCPLLGWPEVWYAFTSTECLNVTVDFCGTFPAFTNFGVWLITGCPCSDHVSSTMYDWTTCGDGNPSIYYWGLPPGTYYVPVFSQGDNQHPYTITITGAPCPPPPLNDVCEDVTPSPLNLGDELTFTGTTAGATATCYLLGWPGDVWDAVETSEPLDITVDYCTTTPAFGYFGSVLVEGCPCTGWYHYGQYNATSCGDDNATITYYNVPAGTWWYQPTPASTRTARTRCT